MSHWIDYIKNRIRKNKNFLGFVSGATGSGKTYSSLSICNMVDKSFDNSRIVFNGLELMRLITSGELKSGSAICFEETGVEMDATQWQSKTNRLINHVIQTFRHKNFVLIFNSPYIDFIDSRTRKLFHAEFETVKIDLRHEVTILRPRLMQYNARYKKWYFKRLRVGVDGAWSPISTIGVPKPPPDILEQYEFRKTQFTDALNQEVYRELTILHEKKMRKLERKEMTARQKEVYDLRCQGLTLKKIAGIIGTNHVAVHNALEGIKKKGYIIEKKNQAGVNDTYKGVEKGHINRGFTEITDETPLFRSNSSC